jgi:hypothetical protein
MIHLVVQFDIDRIDEEDLFATLRQFGDGVKAKGGVTYWKCVERVDPEQPTPTDPEFRQRLFAEMLEARESGVQPSAGVPYSRTFGVR